jgi:hypothetical protein
MIRSSCDISGYLSVLPASDENVSLKTCVIGNGKKLFLRKREAVSVDNENNAPSMPSSGRLLDKPMSVIMMEAEKLQIYQKTQNLYQATEIADRLDAEIDIGNYDMSYRDIAEASLWVDRYSPKVFSEVCCYTACLYISGYLQSSF